MKALKFAIAVLFFSAIFTACKKESASSPNNTAIAGVWAGQYGYDNDDAEFFYSFKIKADGTMEEIDSFGEQIGEGTWTLNGNTFTATHHFLPPYNKTYISTAIYDAAAKKLRNGTWKYSDKAVDEGKWYMLQQ